MKKKYIMNREVAQNRNGKIENQIVDIAHARSLKFKKFAHYAEGFVNMEHMEN